MSSRLTNGLKMSNAMKVTEKREPHKSLNDKGEQCRCAVEDGVEPGDRGKSNGLQCSKDEILKSAKCCTDKELSCSEKSSVADHPCLDACRVEGKARNADAGLDGLPSRLFDENPGDKNQEDCLKRDGFVWGRTKRRSSASRRKKQKLTVPSNDASTETAREPSTAEKSKTWSTKKTRNTPRMKIGSGQLTNIQRTLSAKISDGDLQDQSDLETGHSSENLQDSTTGDVQCSLQQISRVSSRARRTLLSSLAEDSDSEDEKAAETHQRKKNIPASIGNKAISRSGYTCRGRVKQKAQKRVELINIGEKRVAKGWYNAGYIFPLGFKSKTHFRSSIDLDAMCVHECEIVKGRFWPMPTFVITAADRPTERLYSKSCTGCWTLILKRINNEINRRRSQGERLPPPPKTAIAGTEYFGLIQEDILQKIEALDVDKMCDLYWAGKLDRKIAMENLSLFTNKKTKSASTANRSRSRRFKESESESEGEEEESEEGEEEGVCTLSKWSSIGRFDRYRKRCLKRGGLMEVAEDDENPLPDLIDLVTMQPVVTPAISPYGHVMGIATWRACLSEQRVCPFTRNPLTIEQCTILTKHNFNKYREKILHL